MGDQMEFDEAVEKRRSYRAISKVVITDDMVWEMMKSASLSPSCSNKQPWRFVFIREEDQIKNVWDSLSGGNFWAKWGSMMIAVVTKNDLDCSTNDMHYANFDTGMATAFLLLKATDLGLATHPMAGFDKDEAKKVLDIPKEWDLITLIAVGSKSDDLSGLKDWQKDAEKIRNKRKELDEMGFLEKFKTE
jgi:nitroreductase